MKKQLEFIIAGSEVSRYHTIRTLTQETVGHHSHGVAMIVGILGGSRDAIWAALIHDLAEHQTGDIPSPAKREYGIGEQVSELEDRLLCGVGLPIPPLSRADQRLLKLADIAQGALFCVREISLGNRGMDLVFWRYIGYAEDMAIVGDERELFDLILDKYKEVK